MFDFGKYYKKENSKIIYNYEKTICRIKEIYNETNYYKKLKEVKDIHQNFSVKEYYCFFNSISNRILKLTDYENNFYNENNFKTASFEELLNKNSELYLELLPKNYYQSYANPIYCVNLFGDKFGKLMSFFYSNYIKYNEYALYHKIYKMEEYNRLFIKIFNYVKNNPIDYDVLLELITNIEKKNNTFDEIIKIKERFDKDIKVIDIVTTQYEYDLKLKNKLKEIKKKIIMVIF